MTITEALADDDEFVTVTLSRRQFALVAIYLATFGQAWDLWHPLTAPTDNFDDMWLTPDTLSEMIAVDIGVH